MSIQKIARELLLDVAGALDIGVMIASGTGELGRALAMVGLWSSGLARDEGKIGWCAAVPVQALKNHHATRSALFLLRNMRSSSGYTDSADGHEREKMRGNTKHRRLEKLRKYATRNEVKSNKVFNAVCLNRSFGVCC